MFKKSLIAVIMGIMIAQGLVMVSVQPSKANDADGSCAPATDWVCGLNGVNYSDKKYTK